MGHDRKASVAVVGGGIGGLAAAAFLRRAGLDATVYEQTPRLGDVGAALVVAPNAARLLRRLPSAVTLEQVGVVLEAGWEFRRWADGTVLFAQQLGERSPRGPAQPQRLDLRLRRRAGRENGAEPVMRAEGREIDAGRLAQAERQAVAEVVA